MSEELSKYGVTAICENPEKREMSLNEYQRRAMAKTIEEVRAAKQELEDYIASLLMCFDARNRLRVDGVQIKRLERRNERGFIYDVNVEIKL